MKFEYDQKREGFCVYDEAKIHLSDNEIDIVLVFPNGKEMAIQFRLEGPTIDICLPAAVDVDNWIGDDMQPAPQIRNHAHVRLASQLCLGIDPSWLESPEKE